MQVSPHNQIQNQCRELGVLLRRWTAWARPLWPRSSTSFPPANNVQHNIAAGRASIEPAHRRSQPGCEPHIQTHVSWGGVRSMVQRFRPECSPERVFAFRNKRTVCQRCLSCSGNDAWNVSMVIAWLIVTAFSYKKRSMLHSSGCMVLVHFSTQQQLFFFCHETVNWICNVKIKSTECSKVSLDHCYSCINIRVGHYWCRGGAHF